MFKGWNRILAAAAALVMVLTAIPMQWTMTMAYADEATVTLGMVTADQTFVRKKAADTKDWHFRVDKDHLCEVIGQETKNEVVWYKVYCPDPEDPSNVVTGYIHEDYFTLEVPQEVVDEYLANNQSPSDEEDDDSNNSDVDDSAPGDDSAADTDTLLPSVGTAVVGLEGVVKSLVRFRALPSTEGEVYEELPANTIVEILEKPEANDDAHWYKVRYKGTVGYIMASYLTEQKAAVKYGKVNADKTNFRKTAGGDLIDRLNTGALVELLTIPDTATDKDWYKVKYAGRTGYINAPYIDLVYGSVGDDSTGSGSDEVVTVLGYMKTVKPGVNHRLTPGGNVIQQVKRNVVVGRLSGLVNGNWYKVYYNGETGYMRKDCVDFCDASGTIVEAPEVGEEVWEEDSDTSTGDGSEGGESGSVGSSDYGYVKTKKGGVNLRLAPAGTTVEQISKGKILPMTGYSIKSGSYYWYPVKAESGRTGYLRGDCVTFCTSDGTSAEETNKGSGVTLSKYGYIRITSNNVNLRLTPGGDSRTQVDKGVFPATGSSVTYKGYTWYPISANNISGYVRGDHAYKLSTTEELEYLTGLNGGTVGGVTVIGKIRYLQTTEPGVYLREAASKDADHKFQVDEGTVLAFTASKTVGSYTWYNVIYNNSSVWVIDYCVDVLTDEEYKAYIEANPDNVPQTEILLGYVKTTEKGVNLRAEPGSKDILDQIAKGKIFSYDAEDTAKGYNWYHVKAPAGSGWLRGDCVMECDKDGNAVNTGNGSTPPSAGEEATYTTLRKGSKGTAVTNMVTELKKQGYYTGEVTDTYNDKVVAAVRAFQTAKKLDVDGIAGSQTLHALYGTVPAGSGGGSLNFTIYPAEKIDWFTGGIQKLWPKGASFKVFDVKTGKVWWARRWSGAQHADVEPLTAADTATLCDIYGTKTAQQIWDDNLWQRRPCLVTIGSRTFACSLFGMPHNEDGDTIKDNDMVGQICIHFTNSTIHKTDVICKYHKAAIEEAYNYAKNGDPRK